MRIDICSVKIDSYSFDEVVEIILGHIRIGGKPKYVVTPNAHHVFLLKQHPYFRQIYENAFLVVPDGVSLLWAANILGVPLKGRVNGTDLFEALCATAACEGLKIFLLGGRPGAAQKAKEVLLKKHPNLEISGLMSPSYGFEKDKKELKLINDTIRAAKPHIVFVSLGAPKQEKWMYENYTELQVPISIGIGISFELVSGIIQRAPRWAQRCGLEWFFRVIQEPKRLLPRYLVIIPYFLWVLLGNILFKNHFTYKKIR